MNRERRFDRFLRAVSSFFIFFMLSAFLISCCLILFISTMQRTMGITFTQADISVAAKATMLNVLLLSGAFSVIDLFRRKWSIQRPMKRITEATERMIAGDFSVRIPQVGRYTVDSAFCEVIDCINKMAKELSGVEALRSDFIANVSHEMKTPLAVIQNYGTLLQDPTLSQAARAEYAKAITDGSRRLSDMITNILKLNRLENQQIYPTMTRFALDEQLCESLLQYESVWEARNIQIETALDPAVFVSADRELLALVWSNLFSNAFKFTPPGGTVSLSMTASDRYATVRITDTGCGMSPEVGAHIFEKFYQGDTSHATQGNGLGLALVKRIVDILQGEITVESTIGVGTTFTVRIGRNTECV